MRQKWRCTLNPTFFSFFSLFNVFYATADKPSLLKKMGELAKSDAVLAIFDYTELEAGFTLKDLAGRPISPLQLHSLESELNEAGWEVIEITDLSTQFVKWYRSLLINLEQRKEELKLEFFASEIEKFKGIFAQLLTMLENKKLGGVAVFSQKKSEEFSKKM